MRMSFVNQALARKLEFPQYHYILYTIAFINGDSAEMKKEMDWANARPGEFTQFYSQSATAAFAGQMRQARAFSGRVFDAAEGRNLKDTAAESAIAQSLTDAVFGNCERVKEVTAKGIALVRRASPFWDAALALAVCGDGMGQARRWTIRSRRTVWGRAIGRARRRPGTSGWTPARRGASGRQRLGRTLAMGKFRCIIDPLIFPKARIFW
jgi:hypothetical protein